MTIAEPTLADFTALRAAKLWYAPAVDVVIGANATAKARASRLVRAADGVARRSAEPLESHAP